jgi:hypothetical protein
MRHRTRRDTTTSNGRIADTSAHNQDQSGVTNTKTGASTLGTRIKNATPTAGQPVTAKGDTLSAGNKTSHAAQPRSRVRDSAAVRRGAASGAAKGPAKGDTGSAPH